MTTIYKINHWVLFLTFLGLVGTAITADFFFSKEAIMKSFEFSLAHLNIYIPPVDQLYIARIERRITWDWHFYIGVIFFISTLMIVYKYRAGQLFKSKILRYSIVVLIFSAVALSISGIIMYARLYFVLDESYFQLLKKIHDFSKWMFIVFVFIHVIEVIKLENTKYRGLISNMFRGSSLLVLLFISNNNTLYADEVNRDKWLVDKDYVEGMMYLNGQKGVNTILKEISNCPYEKCRKSDVSQDQVLSTIVISIDKPDYKSGVKSLYKSVQKGNFLAADKLVDFLIKRVNYKSNYPDEYILELLNKDVGLSYTEYKEMIKKTIEIGQNGKGCSSVFIGAESFENGYLGFEKDEIKAFKYYKKAYENCLSTTYHYLLAKNKVEKL